MPGEREAVVAPITTSTAIVFHGGGRRYFTLKAAARGQARKLLRQRLGNMGEDWADDDWYRKRLERLTRFYLAQWRRDHLKDIRNEG